jgi:hypothetical protein
MENEFVLVKPERLMRVIAEIEAVLDKKDGTIFLQGGVGIEKLVRENNRGGGWHEQKLPQEMKINKCGRAHHFGGSAGASPSR